MKAGTGVNCDAYADDPKPPSPEEAASQQRQAMVRAATDQVAAMVANLYTETEKARMAQREDDLRYRSDSVPFPVLLPFILCGVMLLAAGGATLKSLWARLS